jgi:antitoxin component YwqK of YwqJK toxin-antitoxin module
MKNFVLMLVFVVLGTHVIAQDTANREIVKKGDVYEVTIFHEDGTISQMGQYNSEGIVHGVWTSFDLNGNKTAVAQYHNGEKTGTWYFYEGDVLKEVKYTQNRVAQVTTWKEGETKVVSN